MKEIEEEKETKKEKKTFSQTQIVNKLNVFRMNTKMKNQTTTKKRIRNYFFTKLNLNAFKNKMKKKLCENEKL